MVNDHPYGKYDLLRDWVGADRSVFPSSDLFGSLGAEKPTFPTKGQA